MLSCGVADEPGWRRQIERLAAKRRPWRGETSACQTARRLWSLPLRRLLFWFRLCLCCMRTRLCGGSGVGDELLAAV